MDLSPKGLVFDRPLLEGDVFHEFDKKFKALKANELKNSLSVKTLDFQQVLSQMV